MACDPTTLIDQAKCIEAKLPNGLQIPALIYLAAIKAGVSTDPSFLVSQANCIECGVPIGQQLPVLVALAALISGDSVDTTSLSDRAKCMECIPAGAEWAVVLSNFCSHFSGSDCTAETLGANAKCIECGMMAGTQIPVLIWIFAKLAGVSTDAQSLVNLSNCVSCGISPGLFLRVLISLTCDFFLSNPSTFKTFTSGLLDPAFSIAVNHGLGKVPEIIQLGVRCVANDAQTGYVAGDELYFGSFDLFQVLPLFAWFPTTTQILVTTTGFVPGQEADCSLQSKAGGGSNSPSDVRNFKLVVYAIAFP